MRDRGCNGALIVWLYQRIWRSRLNRGRFNQHRVIGGADINRHGSDTWDRCVHRRRQFDIYGLGHFDGAMAMPGMGERWSRLGKHA
jgi:hypothetical protein